MLDEKTLGQIAYEKHIEKCFFNIPGYEMCTAKWDELTLEIKGEWEEVAQAVRAALPATEGLEKAIYEAAERGNNKYWQDGRGQQKAFREWREGGSVGSCPQILNGSVPNYIAHEIVSILRAHSAKRSPMEDASARKTEACTGTSAPATSASVVRTSSTSEPAPDAGAVAKANQLWDVFTSLPEDIKDKLSLHDINRIVAALAAMPAAGEVERLRKALEHIVTVTADVETCLFQIRDMAMDALKGGGV